MGLMEKIYFDQGTFHPPQSVCSCLSASSPFFCTALWMGLRLLTEQERISIRHVIVTCCTGLLAPGLDFAAIDYLGLDPSTERTMVGFMGCFAAINGLKLARHIVRSEPDTSVLMINLELCTLHFQETQNLESVLSFLLFGDGCAASLIRSGDRRRIRHGAFRQGSARVAGSTERSRDGSQPKPGC